MPADIGPSSTIGLLEASVSLVLVVVVIAVSIWQRLGLGRAVAWATFRATAQLLAVGLLFGAIFESSNVWLFAIGWVVVMVGVAGLVAARRTGSVRDFAVVAIAVVAIATIVVLAVVFGLRVLDTTPVGVVVIAGITIGNTMPAVVQAVDRMRAELRDQRGEIEAMLALGFEAAAASRRLVAEVIRLALVPQIERTKVVGLIALPGAMTGLLLAGTDPFDAVLIQLVVMFLVLGSVAVSVVGVTLVMRRRAFTADLRLADWAANASSP